MVTVCLYLTCTVGWALDVSVMWTDLYRFIPSRLSLAGIEGSTASEANARYNGPKLLVRTWCEGIVVSCSPIARVNDAQCMPVCVQRHNLPVQSVRHLWTALVVEDGLYRALCYIFRYASCQRAS